MNEDELRYARDNGKTLWHNNVGWCQIKSIPLTGVEVTDQNGDFHMVFEMDLVDVGTVTEQMRLDRSLVKPKGPAPEFRKAVGPRGTSLARGKRLMKI